MQAIYTGEGRVDGSQNRVTHEILRRTGNRVRDLRVTSRNGKVIVHGRVGSRYLWQLALAGARDVLDGCEQLEMQLDVGPQSR